VHSLMELYLAGSVLLSPWIFLKKRFNHNIYIAVTVASHSNE
jgi:hypothetical protein